VVMLVTEQKGLENIHREIVDVGQCLGTMIV